MRLIPMFSANISGLTYSYGALEATWLKADRTSNLAIKNEHLSITG
jgi:hypothetical protein